jgi:uncharacterized protein YdeI (YjbR/CyaY-like superfamily)
MARKNPRLDAYIQEAAPFAKPILKHLRKVVHAGCPDVEEKIKWQFPHFDYKGMMCAMAAFKNHCAFGFWKSTLVTGSKYPRSEDAMGQFGRITSIADLPSEKTLIGYVRKAVELNDAGVRPLWQAERKKRAPLPVPDYLAAALKKNAKARATFEKFSPSHRRDYIEWLTEAKREETRTQRLKTALKWMAEGKARNWKYAR